MILLDTNVVSEPLRPSPEIRVIEWIDAQPLETLYLSVITVAELRAGVALLPAGKRRTSLHEYLEKQVLPTFAGRVLPFDLACTSPMPSCWRGRARRAMVSRLPMPALRPSPSPTDLPWPRATLAPSWPPG